MDGDLKTYWKNNRELKHITPSNNRFPEGFDLLKVLREAFSGQSVLEFGCGDGRLTPAFSPDRYIGYDINPFAIEAAKKNNPGYLYQLDGELPRMRAALAYTVLLHIPDEEIEQTIERLAIASCRVVVAEIMGRKWRRSGLPPVFNRESVEYETLFKRSGMYLVTQFEEPYKRYGGVNMTFMSFERI